MLGFHFLAIERRGNGRDAKNVVAAQGVIQGQIDAGNWMVQFTHAGVPYTNVLETKDLKKFTLFETQDQMIAFVAANLPEAMPKLPPAPPAGASKDTAQGTGKQKKGKLEAVPDKAPASSGEDDSGLPSDDEEERAGGTD